jgi:hypothetical protein
MANNIPGILRRVQPNVFTRVRTRQRVNVAPGGARIACIIGEGETEETLVVAAIGGGKDGVNADFSGSDNPDGRHFALSTGNLVSNRVSILKNGVPLTVLEGTIGTDSFDSRYDCRVDIVNGRLELQRSYLVDFGGNGVTTRYWKSGLNNVGNGTPTVTASSLVSASAPAEVWTARVISIVKDGYGNPIPGEAVISVSGSVSGVIKDANGNPIRWKSDGVAVSNGILNISFAEGVVPYQVGDKFTIQVASGVLAKNDELVAKYIAEADLNDPELFLTPADLFSKHGQPSESNNLSLGAAMAFENGAPAVFAIQAKPSVPRKTCVTLLEADNPLTVGVEGASGNENLGDCIFHLPLGALPDVDTNIAVYITSADGSEEQILLNKVAFYNSSWSTTASAYTNFVTGAFSESYTVFNAAQVEQDGTDGYFTSTGVSTASFTSPSLQLSVDRVDLSESDIGKKVLKIVNGSVVATYNIADVGDGYGNTNKASLTLVSGTNATGAASWQVVDPNDVGAYFALTDDVVNNYLTVGKGLKICYVDTKDADFFDTNWAAAFEAAELIDCQFIVPLPKSTISNIFAVGKSHVEEQSNILNAHERILLIGAIKGLTPDNLVGREDAAVEDLGILEGIQGDDPEEVLGGNIEDLANYSVSDAFGDSFRVVYMAPDEIIRNINGTNTSLHGFYQAAALAGFLSGQTNIAEPPTFRTLSGYSIPRTKTYRPFTLDELADAGVLITQPVAGGGRMLHGLTTTQSNAPEEEEISIVGIRDQVARLLRNSLRPFVGRVNSPTLISEISQGVAKILASLVSQGLLTSFGNITVSRDSVEPRQLNIAAQISPAAPINWIYIDLEVSI